MCGEHVIVATLGQTVEVLQLSPERIDRSGLYGLGDLIVSPVLPELRLFVDELFPRIVGGARPIPDRCPQRNS